MNRYILPCVCSVCGEEGVMSAGEAGMDWFYDYRHTNPQICADNLRYERQRLEKLKKEAVKNA